jgi:hypothetical protein
MIHVASMVVGAGIVAAAAHVSIAAAGGYQSGHAAIVIAVAAGVVVAAVAIGQALADRRIALALTMLVCMLAGEAYGLLLTAERVIAVREAGEAPVLANEAKRRAAVQRIKNAEETKRKADATVVEKAAEKSCVSNCRTLLEGAVTAAKLELDKAREDLAQVPPSKSATPLADRLGISGWTLDLVQAALASVGANGLGATLLAFGSHGGRRRKELAPVAPPQQQAIQEPKPAPPRRLEADVVPVPTTREHAAAFITAAMRRDPAGEINAIDLHRAYLEHCKVTGEPPRGDIGKTLALLLRDLGLTMANNAIRGARLVPTQLKIERAA